MEIPIGRDFWNLTDSHIGYKFISKALNSGEADVSSVDGLIVYSHNLGPVAT